MAERHQISYPFQPPSKFRKCGRNYSIPGPEWEIPEDSRYWLEPVPDIQRKACTPGFCSRSGKFPNLGWILVLPVVYRHWPENCSRRWWDWLDSHGKHGLTGAGMRLSRASIYALYGMSYLASQPSGKLIPLSEIRKNRRLPEKHLAKIFRQLVRGGLLRAVRGVNGGFALARPPHRISPLDIIHVIDGSTPILWCPSHPHAKDDPPCCLLAGLVARGHRSMEAVLKTITLDKLIE